MKSKKTKKEIITDISLISIGSIFLLYLTYGFSFFLPEYLKVKTNFKGIFEVYFGCKMRAANYKIFFVNMFYKENWYFGLLFIILILLGIAAIVGYIYLVLKKKDLIIQKFKAKKEIRKQKQELIKEEKYKQSNEYKIEQLQKELEQLKKEKEKEQ